MKKLLEEAFEAGKKLGQWIENGRNFNMEKAAMFKEWYGSKTINKTKVVCICGSTRFADLHAIKRWELEQEGHIVLMINYLPEWYAKKHFGEKIHDHFGEKTDNKEKLDELHFRKIDLSDELLVINYEGYIGESTSNEIMYGLSKNKPIKFIEGNKNFQHICPGCKKEHYNGSAYGFCNLECYTKNI